MLVVGDRINGTVGPVRRALAERDGAFIADLARSQVECGADFLDVNVGTCEGAPEVELMEWVLGIVRGVTDVPVAVDSSDPRVLAAGLELLREKGTLVNSASAEPARMTPVLTLARDFACPVVALAMDESGIPATPEKRLGACMRIMDAACGLGIPSSEVFFDPLVLPVGVDHEQGRVTVRTLELIKAEIPGAKTIIGLGNISFGLPRRPLLNRALLTAAINAGLDAALLDPVEPGLMGAAAAALAVSGRDGFCRGYLKAYRSGLMGAS